MQVTHFTKAAICMGRCVATPKSFDKGAYKAEFDALALVPMEAPTVQRLEQRGRDSFALNR